MSYGTIKTFPTVVVASGASTSSDVFLGGKAWSKVGVQVGTMSTGMQVMVQGTANGSSYYYVFNRPINSATVACATFSIAAGVGTNGGFVPLPEDTPLNQLRFVLTGVVSGGVSFTVICAD